MSRRIWRLRHYLTFLLFVLVWLHGFQSGTDSGVTGVTLLYWGSGDSLVVLTLYRIVVTLRARLTPARATAAGMALAAPPARPPAPKTTAGETLPVPNGQEGATSAATPARAAMAAAATREACIVAARARLAAARGSAAAALAPTRSTPLREAPAAAEAGGAAVVATATPTAAASVADRRWPFSPATAAKPERRRALHDA